MTMNSGSDGRLTVDSVSNIGPHYARTLREWKRNLLRNWNSTIAKALQDRYGLNEDALEIFKRKWTCTYVVHATLNHWLMHKSSFQTICK